MAFKVRANLENEQGIETEGIERILPQNRGHLRIGDNCTMWLSSNLVIAMVALGVLAKKVFALGFWDGVLAIILFNILGGPSCRLFLHIRTKTWSSSDDYFTFFLRLGTGAGSVPQPFGEESASPGDCRSLRL